MTATTLSRPLALMLAGSAALALAGCGAKHPKDLPPPPAPATEAPPPAPTGPQIVPGSQEDFVASVMSDTIHFDTDKYDIDGQSQQILASQVAWLRKYPNKRVTVEGHADERGTRDYNLALGDRRAGAAKNWLVAQGIDAARIATVSYGKERPIALGSDPESWAKNRRAVTVTIQ